jgi:hypothetical protein
VSVGVGGCLPIPRSLLHLLSSRPTTHAFFSCTFSYACSYTPLVIPNLRGLSTHISKTSHRTTHIRRKQLGEAESTAEVEANSEKDALAAARVADLNDQIRALEQSGITFIFSKVSFATLEIRI